MSQAELVIKSDSVVKTTEALDRLIERFEKLEKATQGLDKGSEDVTKGQTKIKNALDQSAIAQQKAIALMDLERQGLDKNSSQYAKLKAEIIAKDIATKRGIKTDSEEYRILLKNTKAKELATAKTKQLAKAQKEAQKASQNATKNAKGFTGALDDAAKQASLIDGPLGGVASRITTLSGILKNAGGAAGVAIAALGITTALLTREVKQGLDVAKSAEVQMRTFEAQVQATGGAAGFTAKQLDGLSRSLAMSTLDNRQGVSELIGVMTTFRNISGDTFREAIELSQNFGIVMKTNSVSAARTLGKVLENPIENYKQLKRVGIEFDDQQILSMRYAQQAGDIYKAQQVILEELEKSFRNVARAQADTLSGDIDTFGQLWEETFERIGAKLIPVSRSIVQFGNEWLIFSERVLNTDVENQFNDWQKEIEKTTGTLEDTNTEIGKLEAKLESLGNTSKEELGTLEKSFLQIKDSLDWIPAFNMTGWFEVDSDDLSDNQQAALLIQKQVAALKEQAEAQGKVKKGTAELTDKQKEYINDLQTNVDQQRQLTKVYKETGSTRSEEYRKLKAELDAENAAKKVGLEIDKVRKKQIEEDLLSLSNLTEERVRHNTVLQKTKALESKQNALEREIELYNLIQGGVSKSSDAYLKVSAAIDARNSTIQAGLELGSKEHKQIEAQTIALYEKQKEIKAINALKATDQDSATFKSLERQIELQDLLTQGIKENSKEYYMAVAAIDTRNTALSRGIDVGSEDYETLLKQNEALAEMRNQLQQVNNLKELGLSKNSWGKIIVENTRQSILDSGEDMRSLLGELLSSGEIDKSLYDEKIEELKSYFNEGLRELVMPLGITIDEEGKEVLLSSLEAVTIERNEKIRELEQAWKDERLQDEETYAARRNEIMEEYDNKATAKRQETFEKSAEHLARLRQMEVAGNIEAGLENLAAAKKSSSGLAKAAKAMSMFKASTALVDAISNAMSVPWPANIGAISQAFVQGTQLISMASSLNEPSFAFGGVDIQGSGTGRSDSIKANIANGESVITAPATARHKDTLRRMNAGLPIANGGGNTINASPTIVIQGDASENTVRMIDERLRQYEDRVQQIAQSESTRAIQYEQDVGGLLNPI